MANCRVCTDGAEDSLHICFSCAQKVETCQMCDGNGYIDHGYGDIWPCWYCKEVIDAIEEIENKA